MTTPRREIGHGNFWASTGPSLGVSSPRCQRTRGSPHELACMSFWGDWTSPRGESAFEPNWHPYLVRWRRSVCGSQYLMISTVPMKARLELADCATALRCKYSLVTAVPTMSQFGE